MDQSLRVLFDRALSDEPPPPPGDLAQEAMASGRRRRRHRRLAAGGVAAVVTVLAGVAVANVVSTPPPAPTAMSFMAQPRCDQPKKAPTEVAVFLRQDVTDRQRADLEGALRSDPRVGEVWYESREAAYQTFREMYKDSPDLVATVKADQLPESFRLTLARPAERLALQEELQRRPGVDEVVASVCRTSAKEGE